MLLNVWGYPFLVLNQNIFFSLFHLLPSPAVLILYLMVAVGGYAVYGERVLPNVALSMAATPLTLAANVLMAIHLLSAFIIIINPVCQEIEELYSVPRGRFKTL